MNPWEACALEYQFSDEGQQAERTPPAVSCPSVIYPGIYTRSGLDVMGILISLTARPNPKVHIGSVDASCAIIICDLHLPDVPIIYASSPFLALTGYASNEVLGRNCRFLQAPGGSGTSSSSHRSVSKETLNMMRCAVDKNEELQLTVTNFTKNGQRFRNFLTMVPVPWGGREFRYSIGLQKDLDAPDEEE